ncbi:MAG: GGDEF domain-containing protein [Spirochaetales bacterium]|nr:GGDEF domain-containing protein [Spirochaetales bacterium]MCF7939855.1 GGDEF domain-containing protein [Spirochaetales bacterium]
MSRNDEKRIIDLLSQADLVSELKAEDIHTIAEKSSFHRYQDGEPVFSEGDPAKSLYIVESGEVIVQKSDEEGRASDIARYVQGNIFGELDLFTSAKRAASAIAGGETSILEFPERETRFSEFLEEEPAISAKMLHRILVETAGRIRRTNDLVKENSPLVQELQKQVYRDKLTGLYNQVFLAERLREWGEKERRSFALFISKPDNFKALNDTYGHEAGDLAIKIMARRLRDFIGDDERCVRYKGNAMAVLVPGISRDEAKEQAEQIRNFLNRLDVSEAAGGNDFRITASIGVSLYPGFPGTVEQMPAATHELPLEGRARGGNRILFTGEPGTGGS